jgi:Tfp pilus assembly protein PilN
MDKYMVNINLVPQEIKGKIAQAKASANVFSICLVIVFFFAVVGALALAANSMYLEQNLTNIKQSIAKSTSELAIYNLLEDKAIFLNDRAKIALALEQKRPLWSQIVQNLNNSVPQEVQFSSVAFDLTKNPNIVLNGYAKTERDVISFKDKLEASEFFNNVAFRSSQAENKPVETTTTTTATTTTSTTEATAATPTVATPIVTTPTEKRVNFSLEFDLEKYYIANGVTK